MGRGDARAEDDAEAQGDEGVTRGISVGRMPFQARNDNRNEKRQ